jgi:hypothetical protein
MHCQLLDFINAPQPAFSEVGKGSKTTIKDAALFAIAANDRRYAKLRYSMYYHVFEFEMLLRRKSTRLRAHFQRLQA